MLCSRGWAPKRGNQRSRRSKRQMLDFLDVVRLGMRRHGEKELSSEDKKTTHMDRETGARGRGAHLVSQ